MGIQRKVVLLADREAETGALKKLVARHAVVEHAGDIPELLGALEDGRCEAIFCEWSFHRGTWRDVLKAVHNRYPDLPVIVSHHTADEKDWVDVLRASALDLLAPPFNERLVLSVLEHAAWSREPLPAHAKFRTAVVGRGASA